VECDVYNICDDKWKREYSRFERKGGKERRVEVWRGGCYATVGGFPL